MKKILLLFLLLFGIEAQCQTKEETDAFFDSLKKQISNAEKSFLKDTSSLGKDLFLSDFHLAIMLKIGDFRGVVGDAWGKSFVPEDEKKKQKK